jgi:hypothetical protein
VQVIGLAGVIAALAATPKEARALLREAIGRTVRIVTQRTQQAAPRETGALREAIVGVAPKGRGLTGSVSILPGVFRGRVPSAYVLAIEFGAKGRPFIRSTAEAESGRFVSEVSKIGPALEQTLSAIGGRNL